MKLAICIPCYGDPKGKFVQSLVSMLTYTLQVRLQDADGAEIQLQVETFIVSCSMLSESRNKLVAEAMLWGADYMLCLDADHVFPHDTFCRLWAHGLPVVGANYARRGNPTAPTAAQHETVGKGLLYTTKADAEAGTVEPCGHLGFGVVLINMNVFGALESHVNKTEGASFWPLFQFEVDETKIGVIGEDVYFFRKLREAGITAFVDHALSWEVGHITDTILTNAHAVAHKDKWTESRKKMTAKFAAKADELEKEVQK